MSRLLNLPEEFHDDIFLRLPAESILSCRCVCKHFYNLLSKPNFIKNHLDNQTKHNNKPKLLFRRFFGPEIYSIGIDYDALLLPPKSSRTTALCDFEFGGSVLINYSFQSNNLVSPHVFVLGSCNGLICLKIFSVDRISVVEIDYYFSILNPLTKEFKDFTKPEKIYGDITYGFGYDRDNDDYKLVIISGYDCFKIDIYTLRKDSWSSIQGTVKFSFRRGKGYYGVSFNGYLHWLGRVEDTHGTFSEVILSFEISNEMVVNMPLPENMILPHTDYSGDVYKNVGVWGDCIGIACIWGSDKIDVWVMQEYGVTESWIRKYTTTQLPSLSSEVPFWRPLWCFDNGEILVDNDRRHLLLYNPTTERVRSVVVCDISMDNIRQSYVESIVSVGSGTYMEKRITDGVVKNSEPRRSRQSITRIRRSYPLLKWRNNRTSL